MLFFDSDLLKKPVTFNAETEEIIMKFTSVKNKKLHKKESSADSNDLTRSAFELFYVFAVLLFSATIVFTVFFRIVTFQKNSSGRMRTYSVVSLPGSNGYKAGDIVSVDVGENVSAAEIIALEGEEIVIGANIDNAVNCVLYKDVRYFSGEELEQILDGRRVPKGYVMLDGDITGSQELRVGELIKKSDITGKVRFVVYPFSFFGKDAADIKN